MDKDKIEPMPASGTGGYDIGAAGYSSHGNQTGEPPTECGQNAYSDNGSNG